MSDITCAKCGEPWDAQHARDTAAGTTPGDLGNPSDARQFLIGKGCPSCQFGTACPSCNGTGKDADDYGPPMHCCRNGTALAWKPNHDRPGADPQLFGTGDRDDRPHTGYRAGRWYYGYLPHVIDLSELEPPVSIVRRLPLVESGDGWAREAFIVCPTCNGRGDHLRTCGRCKGSGKLTTQADEADELEIDAARSHMDASDEEPGAILQRRGLEA